MALEDLTGGKFIDALDRLNPDGATDQKNEGDDHIAGFKNVVLNTFAFITGAITSTHTELNITDGDSTNSSVVIADSDQMIINDAGVMKQTAMSDLKSYILSIVYPVGAIYASTASASPATIIGGTWVALADKQTLVQQGTYAAGTTGGSSTAVNVSHTHTQVAHTHTYTKPAAAIIDVTTTAFGGRVPSVSSASTGSSTPTINSSGVSGANANMPPYLSVYMWKRTA